MARIYGIYKGEEVLCISGKDKEAVQEVVSHFEEEIIKQNTSEENYGLLYQRCGFDGKRQCELSDYYMEEYGVYVF